MTDPRLALLALVVGAALTGCGTSADGQAPTDVRGAVVHPHDVARLGEHLGGGEPGDARTDDRDAHGHPGIRSCRPKSAMISLIALMSGGPSGSSANAW